MHITHMHTGKPAMGMWLNRQKLLPYPNEDMHEPHAFMQHAFHACSLIFLVFLCSPELGSLGGGLVLEELTIAGKVSMYISTCKLG